MLDDLQVALGDAYALERELGGGGMARVFLAEERRLKRRVVIKILTPELAAGVNAQRFQREIEFLAQLLHPQIVPLLSAGEASGLPFYTMPFIDGESLRARIAREPLGYREAIELLRDIAKALRFAHARGVIHRDIKPDNVLLSGGSAVVTDFGIARAIAESHRVDAPTLTQSGVAIGTPGYMSPEQITGEATTDQRTDIYAFGCLAYEMLTGSRPFEGATTMAVWAAQITRRPPAVAQSRPDVPRSLARLIDQCLEKDPASRPQSAQDLMDLLDQAGTELSDSQTTYRSLSRRDHVALAVLPFRELGEHSDNAHLGLGLTDATITELALVKALLVRPTSAIVQYRDREVDALTAGRELGVDAVVSGSFQRSGARLRVTVQLVDAHDGSSLWGTKLTTSLDDIFLIQDEVSHRIAEALEIQLTKSEQRQLGQMGRVHGHAYEHYARGRLLLLTEALDDTNRAVEQFEKALEIDPRFAKAYVGLSDAYARIAFTWVPDADWYSRAEDMCARALAIDPALAEGQYLRGRLLWSPPGGFDHAGAIRAFVAALTAQPNQNEAHHWLGIVLFHLSMLDEAMQCFDRALEINPADQIALLHVGFCCFLQGRFRETLAINERIGPEHASAWQHYQTALAYLQLDDVASAEQMAASASRRFPGDVLFYPIRALIATLRGDRDRAMRQIELTIANRKSFGHYHHAQYDVACSYAQLGDHDRALEWLTAAAQNGFPCARFFERDRFLAPVHSDARFPKLMSNLRAECDRYATLYEELRRPVVSGERSGA